MSFDPAKVQELREAVTGAREYQPEQANGEQAKATIPPKRRRLIVRAGNTINDAPTAFLWHRRLAMGSINIVFSRPGHGKSTLAARVAGHITTGRDWPDGQPCQRGSVLYVKGEGSDAAIRDRMSQAGADAGRYAVIGRADDDDAMIDLGTTEDVGLLGEVIERMGDIRLVVIDTLDSLYSSMRMIDNANIRRCLWPLQELAEQVGFCVLLLAHTNKGAHVDPLDRLSGGRAIGGAARSVWMLGKREHDSDETFLASVKCSDFVPASSIGFEIVGTSTNRPGAIRWGDVADDVSAYDLDRTGGNNTGGITKGEQAADWIRDALAGGPRIVGEMRTEAKEAGFGRKAFDRGRDDLGAVAKAAEGSAPPVYWLCLPDQAPPPSIRPLKGGGID